MAFPRSELLEYLMDKGVDPEIHNADGATAGMVFSHYPASLRKKMGIYIYVYSNMI